MRAATTTPVDAVRAHHARLRTANGLPRCYGESASTTAFRGLLSVHSRCGPHGPLASLRGLFKQCFSPFVTSWTAPCASGRSASWPGRNFTDGSIVPLQGTHNNWVENRIRPIALGRSNWLFAGSEAGGKRAAQIYSLIGSAKLNGLEPLAYLTDILERLPTARMKDLEAMLPWNWRPAATINVAAELDKPPAPLILTLA